MQLKKLKSSKNLFALLDKLWQTSIFYFEHFTEIFYTISQNIFENKN